MAPAGSGARVDKAWSGCSGRGRTMCAGKTPDSVPWDGPGGWETSAGFSAMATGGRDSRRGENKTKTEELLLRYLKGAACHVAMGCACAETC